MNFYGKNKEKKKKAVLALSVLAVAAMIAGTFAWTSYNKWEQNHMQSRGFEAGEVNIVEDFKNKVIMPGAELKKTVNVVNSSESNVLVRVSFEEMLHKLVDGAVMKDYTTKALAKFPVIIDAKEYQSVSSGYVDRTADLLISGVAPTPLSNVAGTTEGYKMYVNSTTNDAVVFYLRDATTATGDIKLPQNFDPTIAASKIPAFTGDVAAGTAFVAQKLKQGTMAEIPAAGSSKFDFATMDFYGYGEDLDTLVAKELDWAGTNINLSSSVTAVTPITNHLTSAADSNITFKMSTVSTAPAAIGSTDWYFNALDGYFYYTKKLETGKTTDTPVLESVTFPGSDITTQEYGVAAYDLHVGMEAITPYVDSMEAASDGTSNGGWGLAPGSIMHAYYTNATGILEVAK